MAEEPDKKGGLGRRFLSAFVIVITHDIEAAVMVSDTLWMLGFDHDLSGKPLPGGARLQSQIDLIERGLAWRPEVEMLPAFASTVREVKAAFHRL